MSDKTASELPREVIRLIEDFHNPCFGSEIHNEIPRKIGLAILKNVMTDKPASETPRTDAAVMVFDGTPGQEDLVNADFARILERALHAAERKLDVAESERVKYVEKYEYACQRERAAEERAQRLEGELNDAHSKLAGLADTIASARRNINPFDDPHLNYLGDMREDVWKLSYIANSQTHRACQAEQSLTLERAARVRAEGVIAAVRNLIGQVDYTRGMADSDPSKGTGNYLADALDAYDQALAQEGRKP